MRTWRFLDTGYRSAAENMALDDIILECRSRNSVPNTVRFLQFCPPSVLVGFHQVVEHEVRVGYCRSKGIDINRRITGGGAIFFESKSLGWEIFAAKSEFADYQHLEELYEKMCRGVVFGLKTLRIQASFRPKNDVEVEGRKISGTGGTERGEAFLFQGTLLIDFDVDTMLRALRIPIAKLKDKEVRSVKERVTCVKWELEHQPSLDSIKKALREGFEQAFDVRLADGELTRDENTLLRDRLDQFQSDKWIFLERRPLEEAMDVQAIDKTPGGLIRVSLAVDRGAKIIKSALITGDFFAYPSRAMLDLEASLKYISFNEEEIRKTVNHFFETSKAHVIGVAPEDFVQLILEAIGKIDYEKFGINPTEANHLYAIPKNGTELLKNGFEFLLLPYCAKPLTCEYRKREGCTMCGECSVGTAYELAFATGLKPITIQNFEHLMKTLEKLKRQGVKGYIGCCCEAFIYKHQEDLKKAGIPALLLDINQQTCYDLGKDEDALKGNFESQTELRINLLSKLVGGNCIKNKNSLRDDP